MPIDDDYAERECSFLTTSPQQVLTAASINFHRYGMIDYHSTIPGCVELYRESDGEGCSILREIIDPFGTNIRFLC